MEGLALEDQHLLFNTLSTISNLIRHGSVHIPELIDSETFAKMVELYSKATTEEQVNYFNNVLKKAVKFPEFTRVFSKAKLRTYLERHISNRLVKKDRIISEMRQMLS